MGQTNIGGVWKENVGAVGWDAFHVEEEIEGLCEGHLSDTAEPSSGGWLSSGWVVH